VNIFMKSKQKKLSIPKNKTKIICTIGPASQQEKTLQDLIFQGMTIARLNFSHGTFNQHLQTIQTIYKVAEKNKTIIPILIDLPGAKIRIGKLENEPLYIETESYITLTTKKILGTATHIFVDFPKFLSCVSVGSSIFLNDGFIELKVKSIHNDEVYCKVVMGGFLHSKKGVNIPGKNLPIDPITSRDLESMKFGLQHGITIFSASFIEKEDDIIKLKKFAKKQKKDIKVIAKIERNEAIQHFDEILHVSDGVMIARGDLGIHIPLQDVPAVQKQLIKKANNQGKPVITATQMLKSMTDNSRPTRAEVTDVANAIYDGTDVIMLSEETAIGKYPIQSVTMMKKIALATEKNRHNTKNFLSFDQHICCSPQKNHAVNDVISLTVNQASQLICPKFILVTTESGSTARHISRFKPESWILAFSRNFHTSQFLLFSYGVFPFTMQNPHDSWHQQILTFIKQNNLVKNKDIVLLTQRRFAKQQGGTDSLGIICINENSSKP
jgi:pyruvate kinase